MNTVTPVGIANFIINMPEDLREWMVHSPERITITSILLTQYPDHKKRVEAVRELKDGKFTVRSFIFWFSFPDEVFDKICEIFDQKDEPVPFINLQEESKQKVLTIMGSKYTL
jgi:hypothetical protein